MNNSTKIFTAVIACCAGIVALLALGLCVTAAGLYWFIDTQQITFSNPTQAVWELPTEAVPPTKTTPPENSITPSPPIEIQPTSSEPPAPKMPAPVPPNTPSGSADASLHTLENTVVPINDPIDLARRLDGKQNLPRSLDAPLHTYQVGDRQSFWATDSDNNTNFEISATLRYITDHVYFWIEDGVSYDRGDLKALAETFEKEIYPKNREFFGSEWTPGVDADPHLYILYARGIGSRVAGYFSSADEYLPQAREYSNAHEMFLLSADHVDLGEEYAYGVLAHEFQHMIHWNGDRNEDTWVNEGFSDLAMLLNRYSIGGADWEYAQDPDIQLTDWPDTPETRTEHYGASFLFVTYFLDRFGEEATKALVADPDNGMVSIDKVLATLGITDPQTGKPLGADDVFADWVLATFLQDDRVQDGRFTYTNYPSAPNLQPTERVDSCPIEAQERDVHQYGVDYIQVECRGDYTLRFEGQPFARILPVDPHSGDYVFYSNTGDESDMTLTREFDFTSHSGPLTLNYWTWYDLEEDYDYLYLVASTDGEKWDILTTPSGTADDPVGNSYGWGYNGHSGDEPQWIEEKVDLSQYAGKKVQLRFEYITDAAVNGEGFLLDDVTIPEINYATDFENDDGGWQAAGFVRIENVLPQTFRLALIYQNGNKTTVEKIELPADNLVEIPISVGRNEDSQVTLVVSGTTRFTRQQATYQFSLLPR